MQLCLSEPAIVRPKDANQGAVPTKMVAFTELPPKAAIWQKTALASCLLISCRIGLYSHRSDEAGCSTTHQHFLRLAVSSLGGQM
jgi:hypothetical protein